MHVRKSHLQMAGPPRWVANVSCVKDEAWPNEDPLHFALELLTMAASLQQAQALRHSVDSLIVLASRDCGFLACQRLILLLACSEAVLMAD